MPPDDQLSQIVMRGQIALRDFLLADLDLAFTLLERRRLSGPMIRGIPAAPFRKLKKHSAWSEIS